MNGFISVAEVRAEPKQPGFITVHTMVAQLPVQCRTFLGMEPWVHTTYYKLAIEYDNDNPYKYVDLYVTWTP